MSRKDYVLLAGALNQALTVSNSTQEACGIALATGHIMDALASDNPRFDRGQFLDAVRGNS